MCPHNHQDDERASNRQSVIRCRARNAFAVSVASGQSSSTFQPATSATSVRSVVRHAARSPRRRSDTVTELPMRFHPLASDVKCPACGADLTFVRVRGGYGDLYQCASGARVDARSCTTEARKPRLAATLPFTRYGALGVDRVRRCPRRRSERMPELPMRFHPSRRM